MDDILVWGEDRVTWQQVEEAVRSTEHKLENKQRQTGGLIPDVDKVWVIQEMPESKDKAALQRFMGMVQYLAKFIPNLSEVSAPLRKLLEGETIWHWECEQQRSFMRLKELVSTMMLKTWQTLSGCQFRWFGSCDPARTTCGIWLKVTNTLWTKICSNWKRATSNCKWLWKNSPISVWETCSGWVGSQTVGDNFQKATP